MKFAERAFQRYHFWRSPKLSVADVPYLEISVKCLKSYYLSIYDLACNKFVSHLSGLNGIFIFFQFPLPKRYTFHQQKIKKIIIRIFLQCLYKCSQIFPGIRRFRNKSSPVNATIDVNQIKKQIDALHRDMKIITGRISFIIRDNTFNLIHIYHMFTVSRLNKTKCFS